MIVHNLGYVEKKKKEKAESIKERAVSKFYILILTVGRRNNRCRNRLSGYHRVDVSSGCWRRLNRCY